MADLLFCDLRRRRERRFRIGTQCEIDDFTDKELRARYRVRQESVLFITNLVAHDISPNTRQNHALPPLHQVLIALRFYASGSFLQVIGDTFGVDKSTVSRAITDVSRALIVKQPRFIKWPSTNDECATIKNEFYILCNRMRWRNPRQITSALTTREQLCQQERISFHKCARCLQPWRWVDFLLTQNAQQFYKKIRTSTKTMYV